MTGAFSGTIYASDYTTKVVITEGEFKLKRGDQNNNTNNPPVQLDFIEFKADNQPFRVEMQAGTGAVLFQTDSATFSTLTFGHFSFGGNVKSIKFSARIQRILR